MLIPVSLVSNLFYFIISDDNSQNLISAQGSLAMCFLFTLVEASLLIMEAVSKPSPGEDLEMERHILFFIFG